MNATAANNPRPDKYTCTSLSSGQLQELRGVITKPLGGRHVMIPLTSKAFVIGSLDPTIDSDGEEEVKVRHGNGSELETCCRKIVCAELENEQQRRKEATKAAKKTKSTTKQASTDSNSIVYDGNNKANDSHTDNATVDNGLPYFEIKEEIDGAGRVVRSEAINVTKQLELVAKHVGECEAKQDESKDDQHHIGTSDESKENLEDSTISTSDSQAIPNDEQYKFISSRLDELARMEDQAETQLAENRLSALKLQSKGWSKGFLGGSKKSPHTQAVTTTKKEPIPDKVDNRHSEKPKKLQEKANLGATSTASNDNAQPTLKPITPPTTSPKPADTSKAKGGWSKGFLNKTKQPTAASGSTPNQGATSKPDSDVQQKKVKFQPTVSEVRETPRLGTTSVAQLKKPSTQSSLDKNANGAESKPFDSSVFSGVVKERTIAGLQNQQGQQGRGKEGAKSESKRKLSRFAQERMHKR